MGRKKKNRYLYRRADGYIDCFEIKDHIDGEVLVHLMTGVAFKRDEYVLTGKESEDIMELIEDEDIVEIEYYVRKYRHRITRRFIVNKLGNILDFEGVYADFTYYLDKKEWKHAKGYNPKIKRILTIEEYERRVFEVM